jgi:hypothetical protein
MAHRRKFLPTPNASVAEVLRPSALKNHRGRTIAPKPVMVCRDGVPGG